MNETECAYAIAIIVLLVCGIATYFHVVYCDSLAAYTLFRREFLSEIEELINSDDPGSRQLAHHALRYLPRMNDDFIKGGMAGVERALDDWIIYGDRHECPSL
jgi:hypothetical protein